MGTCMIRPKVVGLFLFLLLPVALFCLVLLMSCGGNVQSESETESYICENLYVGCEHQALRSGDILLQWANLWDCSFDYGACLKKIGETNCDYWCQGITWIYTPCQTACFVYTKTSTVGAE